MSAPVLPIRPDVVRDVVWSLEPIGMRVVLEQLRDRLIEHGEVGVADWNEVCDHALAHPILSMPGREVRRPADVDRTIESLADHGLPDGVA